MSGREPSASLSERGFLRYHLLDHLRWLFYPGDLLIPGWSKKIHRKIRVPGWGTLLLVGDQPSLTSINRATGREFLGGKGNAFLAPLFGTQSVFTMDGETHRLARRLIAKALSKEARGRLQNRGRALVAEEFNQIGPGQRVHAGKFARQLTMRIMTELLLGDSSSKTCGDLLRAMGRTTGYMANIASYQQRFWKARGSLSVGRYVEHLVGAVDGVIYGLIAESRRKQSESEDSRPQGSSLLDLLVREQAKHGYDDAFIRDNLVSTLAAAQDTTAAALCWMMYWLPQQGHFQRMRASMNTLAGKNLQKSFIQETLRICPPLEILPRALSGAQARTISTEVPDYDSEVTLVCPCPHLAHHDSAVFSEPNRFDIDRFVGRSFKATQYFPFGAASRLCLGVNVAPAVMEWTLQHMVEEGYWLEFDKKRFSPVRRNVSLWPAFRPMATVRKLALNVLDDVAHSRP